MLNMRGADKQDTRYSKPPQGKPMDSITPSHSTDEDQLNASNDNIYSEHTIGHVPFFDGQVASISALPYNNHLGASTPMQDSLPHVIRLDGMRRLHPAPAPWPCVPEGVCPDAMARLSANAQLYAVCKHEGILPSM
ncbi:hypothetical protein HaLaN_09549, partial [Haematococcus lacustris]